MKRSNGYKSSNSRSHIRASPVLGAVVMVAITVLFVAVLGAFTFGMSLGSISTPQATMSTELSVPNDKVKITHIGGDPLSADRTRIVIENQSDGEQITFGPNQESATFDVGQTIIITTTSGSIEGWESENGSQSFELRRGLTYTIMIMDTKSEAFVYRASLTTA